MELYIIGTTVLQQVASCYEFCRDQRIAKEDRLSEVHFVQSQAPFTKMFGNRHVCKARCWGSAVVAYVSLFAWLWLVAGVNRLPLAWLQHTGNVLECEQFPVHPFPGIQPRRS